jgi:exopolyphosphatase/pppGpp-phosphohydrolase
METWFSENRENPKIAVLELSTKAVKMLFADQEKLLSNGFDFSCFIRDTQKTETGNGLDINNRMNMNYFNSRVLPAIQKRVDIIKQNKVDVIYCVATAAYRTASNRAEIVKTIKDKTGVNVGILSKNEEAEATLWAYTFSTKNKDKFLKAKNIIMIDQGGGSTEITIFKDQHLVKSNSFEVGTTVLKNLFFQKDRNTSVANALAQIDKESTDKIKTLLHNFYIDNNADEIYCVCVGTAITEATPGRGNQGKHDKVLTRENLLSSIERYTDKLKDNFQNIGILERKILADNDLERVVVSRLGLPLILEFMNHFGIISLNVSGTGLWYGVFFKELYKID